MGVVPPEDGFLQGLRTLCDRHGALLIFDEVITGFRLAAGGAQEYFGVQADLVTYGKIIGGGMPVGAYAGSRALMEQVAPTGPVYQAGTLSGNPVAMAAGLAQLNIITDHPEIYTVMETSASYIANHLRASAERHGIAMQVNQIGSLLCPYFTETPVNCYAAAKKSDTKRYAAYFNGMLKRGFISRRVSLRRCSFRPCIRRTTSPARCRRRKKRSARWHKKEGRGCAGSIS